MGLYNNWAASTSYLAGGHRDFRGSYFRGILRMGATAKDGHQNLYRLGGEAMSVKELKLLKDELINIQQQLKLTTDQVQRLKLIDQFQSLVFYIEKASRQE